MARAAMARAAMARAAGGQGGCRRRDGTGGSSSSRRHRRRAFGACPRERPAAPHGNGCALARSAGPGLDGAAVPWLLLAALLAARSRGSREAARSYHCSPRARRSCELAPAAPLLVHRGHDTSPTGRRRAARPTDPRAARQADRGDRRRVGAQLDEISTIRSFSGSSGAWRGLWFVVERTSFDENIRLELLNCSKDDLRDDFASAGATDEAGSTPSSMRAIGRGRAIRRHPGEPRVRPGAGGRHPAPADAPRWRSWPRRLVAGARRPPRGEELPRPRGCGPSPGLRGAAAAARGGAHARARAGAAAFLLRAPFGRGGEAPRRASPTRSAPKTTRATAGATRASPSRPGSPTASRGTGGVPTSSIPAAAG